MATLEIYTKIPETESYIDVITVITPTRIISNREGNCNIPAIEFKRADRPDISHACLKMTWKELKDLRRKLQDIEKYEHGDKPKKYM